VVFAKIFVLLKHILTILYFVFPGKSFIFVFGNVYRSFIDLFGVAFVL
jgi:hypothetical protein